MKFSPIIKVIEIHSIQDGTIVLNLDKTENLFARLIRMVVVSDSRIQLIDILTVNTSTLMLFTPMNSPTPIAAAAYTVTTKWHLC